LGYDCPVYPKDGDNFQRPSGVATIGRRRFEPFPLHISLPVAANAVSNWYNPLTFNNQTLQHFSHPPPPQKSFLQFMVPALLLFEETGRF
jgi:hypothetical protein